MREIQIVAHRGMPNGAPENTIEAFQKALELGADSIEFDVRLTLDRVPVVYHSFNLDGKTTGSGGIFHYTLKQLREVEVVWNNHPEGRKSKIPTLDETLERFGGKIGLEIHLQGPEPEAARIIGRMMNERRDIWESVEVTSYEPAMLLAIGEQCPGLAADLLFPLSESWMTSDIVEYLALHKSRLARARAVHLHPTQLSGGIITTLRNQGIDIHAWDVNDERSLDIVAGLGIRRVCTDAFEKVQRWRSENETDQFAGKPPAPHSVARTAAF